VGVEQQIFTGGHQWTPAFIEISSRFIDKLLKS
jgi:hypothetical protein